MKVENILRSKGVDVFTVSEGMSIREAVSVLGDKNIGAVIVRGEDQAVTGILSERDVVRRLRSEGAGALELSVKACMTANPYTCEPDATIDDILGQMTTKRIRHMPVVKDGQLIGVVSIGDVVKRKIELAELEAEQLKGYIAS